MSKPNLSRLRWKPHWTRPARRPGLISPSKQDEINWLNEQNQQLAAQLIQCEEVIARARLQALIDSQFKSELLARVNHDLRQPLGAILGFSEMMRDGIFGPVTEAQQHAIDEIIRGNQRLSQMVTDLLDAARLDSQNLHLRMDAFSPEQLLRQVYGQMRPLAERQGVVLTTELDAQLPMMLQGDVNRISQILHHLVENAIKFTWQGRVSLRADRLNSEEWSLSVADTGCGIAAEAMADIFEPFNQVNDPAGRARDDLGLGLSIVQQLVQLMGGQIRVDSTVGVGSTFTVILPFDPEAMKGNCA